MKQSLRPLSWLSLITFLILTFQNCSRGFELVEMQSLNSDSSLSTPLVPLVVLDNPIPALINKNNMTVSFKISLDAKATLKEVRCQLDEQQAIDCKNLSWNLQNLVEGDHRLKILATDSLGQKSLEQVSIIRVDITSPVLSISSKPAAVTGVKDASISFSAIDNLSGVKQAECSLDQAPFASCASPLNLSNLAVGAHSVRVRAMDNAGNISAIQTISWSIDLSAPTLTITARPSTFVSSKNTSVAFNGTSGASAITGYQCSLNNAAFANCTSPVSYNNLSEGKQSFTVRVLTAAGVYVGSDVKIEWTVDTVAPQLPTVTANVASVTSAKSANISFSSTDATSMIASYQCRLDSANFSSCTSPSSLVNLAEGNRSFQVRAIDNAGNTSEIKTFTWTVDSVIPALAITSKPALSTMDTVASFVFTVSDSGSGLDSVTCQLDSGGAAPCTSPYNLNNISSGNHSVKITATDKAGNLATANHSWTVGGSMDGAALYATNCSICHDTLAKSAKINRTSAQITNAIASIPQMGFLKSLSSTEIDAISKALKQEVPTEQPLIYKYSCTSPNARGVADARMRRMLRKELENTLRDILGGNIFADSRIQTELTVISSDVMRESPNELTISHSDAHASAMLKIAVAASELSLSQTADRNRIYGTCAGDSTVTDACAKSFISSFGLQVNRRPLTTAEATTLFDYYKKQGGTEGLRRTFMRMLMGPSMTYHMEIGAGAPQDGRIRLTDYEVASRISYRVANTMPDKTLLDAAAAGQLKTVAQVEAQIRRLMNGADAKTKLADFTAYYLQTSMYNSPNANAGRLQGIDVSSLREEMVQETRDFVDNVIWTKKGTFKDLFTSKEVFPRSSRMAKILETSIANGTTASLTSEAHAGILLRPGALANQSDRTNPMHRGANLRQRILCDTLGIPDPVAVSGRLAELGDTSDMPNFERYTKLTDVPKCMSCHVSINPIGFSMEGYDQLGMRRSVESLFNPDGSLAKTKPLDTRAVAANIEYGAADNFNSIVEMSSAIANGNKSRACFAKYVFEFQRSRSIASEDSCAMADIEKMLGSSTSILETLIKGLANDDIFWKGI